MNVVLKKTYWIAFWMWIIAINLISLTIVSAICCLFFKIEIIYYIFMYCVLLCIILFLLFYMTFISSVYAIGYLIHFTWDEYYKTFRNLDLVEDRYAQAQKALFSIFPRLSGVLIILGFLPRAIKAYEHEITFAPMNITEDLSFSALFLSATIISTAVILITYLFYIHYIARQIVLAEDWIEEEKIKIKNIKEMVKDIAQMKLPQKDLKKLFFIWKRFFINQLVRILFCTIIIIIIIIIITEFFFIVIKENNYIQYLIDTLSLSIIISSFISGLYLPRARIIVWINVPLIFIICMIFDMISVADRYPQQYGGFRPEHYIAKWKGEDKEKRIIVVYKTDKFLFCQPEDAQKNPNWKCTILSTEGLERLVPDTQQQASKQEPH